MAGAVWSSAGQGATSSPPPRLNVVLFLTDDQSFESVAKMPYLASRTDWYRFDRAFINNATCCPSRATILTGQWSHHHGVEQTSGTPRYDDSSTLATWLDDAGYRTGFFGKYHLGSTDRISVSYVPPGWDDWRAYRKDSPVNYYDYTLNENGESVAYGSAPSDYSTDVFGDHAVDFIDRNAGSPFFLVYAPRAPHDPYQPAPRHEGAFANEPVHHSPNFNEANVSDKPQWWRELAPRKLPDIDQARRKQYELLLAVDEALERTVRALSRNRVERDTVLIFMTDNGYAFGEHRWRGKVCQYEECHRTPLIVKFRANEDARRFGHLVGNEDLAPTIADLAGIAPGGPVDGQSFARMLRRGAPPTGWENEVLLRALNGNERPGNPPSYWGIRTRRHKYVETVPTGEKELYDLTADPFELENVAGQAQFGPIQGRLAARLDELRTREPR